MYCKALWHGSSPSCPANKAALAPVFSTVCAEVTWACWSHRRIYFLSCFQLAHRFPSLPFSPSLPLFLFCPKASLGCPQERKNCSLHRDKESQMALLEPGNLRAELTLLFWVDEATLFPISPVLGLSWSKEANPELSKSPTTPNNHDLSFACTFYARTFPHCFLCVWVNVMTCCGFVAF